MTGLEARMNRRAARLADRIEEGAAALASFAEGLNDAEWRAVVHPDGRTVGVIVHHVGNMYPVEVELAQVLAAGKPIQGVTWAVVADINANHAREQAAVTKVEALAFLRKNSKAAADAVRAIKDEDLDNANTVSLYGDPPLTAQFFIEDHALRHSWHHLAKIRAALKK
jgi:DinB family protein